MNIRKTSAEIEREAADWLARMDSDTVTEQDKQKLHAWLAADRRHQGAYVRAEAAWAMLDRARALVFSEWVDSQTSSVSPTSPTSPTSPYRRRLLAAGGALAASTIAGLLVWRNQFDSYDTQLGEVRSVPLADGSRVAINTASRIEVALEPAQRIIRLKQGEVWFEVAKDASRPFIVEAGSVRVRAVGTAFSVYRKAEGAEIMVSEGVVEVWSVKHTQVKPVQLSIGSRVLINDDALLNASEVSAAQISRDLAWRDGHIELNGETLLEAAEKFNRYNQLKIVINDPVAGQHHVVGYFEANNPKGFAEAVTKSLDVHADFAAGTINLRAGS